MRGEGGYLGSGREAIAAGLGFDKTVDSPD